MLLKLLIINIVNIKVNNNTYSTKINKKNSIANNNLYGI